MNYELAKQLKEAGFIQRTWRYSFHFLKDTKNPAGERMVTAWEVYQANKETEETYYRPDLSELIEACGDRFWHLQRLRIDSNKWTARAFTVPLKETEGSTPEEAVALLWLELNKKI